MSLAKGIFAAAQYAAASIPEKPKLAPWIVAVELGEGRIQLRSATTRFTLPHAFFSPAFQAVHPYLDGSHSLEAISSAAAVDSTTVDFLLRMLASNGLLLPGEPLTDSANERFRFFAQINEGAAEGLRALEAKHVWLVGNDAMGKRLIPLLAEAGLPTVEAIDSELPDLIGHCGDLLGRNTTHPDLIIAFATGSSDRMFNLLDDFCQAKGITWIAAILNGPRAQLGPTFIPGQTACYRCLKTRLNSNSDDYLADVAFDRVMQTQSEPSQGHLEAFTAVVAGQLVLETVRLLSRMSNPLTVGRLYCLDALTPNAQAHDVLRVPRCPSCSQSNTRRRAWDVEPESRI